jgi:hypothetical protein
MYDVVYDIYVHDVGVSLCGNTLRGYRVVSVVKYRI